MDFLYVILILVGVPLIGIILGNLIIEFWDGILKQLKIIGRFIGQIIFVITFLLILGLLCNWLFKDCAHNDPEKMHYDYDPGLNRKY